MKTWLYFIVICASLLTATTYYGCKKNANGRNTLSLVDDGTILSMSSQQYSTFIATNPPVTGTPDAAMVQRVGAKLTAAVATYLAGKGKSDIIKDYNWEFNLVNNAEVNAWCLPGGKIVVYSGIMSNIATDEDLAVVLGHEISHAILKHGNERMSQQMLVEFGGAALSEALSTKPDQTRTVFNSVYGLSSNLSVLAYSRKHENEADETGLYIMATGDYNPNVAVAFWERMKAASTGSKPPVFMSTHPSDDQRIQNLKDLMPKALGYYNP